MYLRRSTESASSLVYFAFFTLNPALGEIFTQKVCFFADTPKVFYPSDDTYSV